jgi:hypothetical protein
VHSRQLPPISGGSGDHHDVICIETKKVFDFCFQEEHIERTFNVQTDTSTDVIVVSVKSAPP